MNEAINDVANNTVKAYTGFKKMCTLLNLPYNYLKRLPYPINYKGIIMAKIAVNFYLYAWVCKVPELSCYFVLTVL